MVRYLIPIPVRQHAISIPTRGTKFGLASPQLPLRKSAGEFVAEVGGKRMRLKPCDSSLMPMKVPHRWSVAQEQRCGAIHLYSPAA
jgi:hypothetical protein